MKRYIVTAILRDTFDRDDLVVNFDFLTEELSYQAIMDSLFILMDKYDIDGFIDLANYYLVHFSISTF